LRLLGFNEKVDLDGVLFGHLLDHIVQNLSVMLPDPITVKFARILEPSKETSFD
jgi:hypothetical protein